jgi:hypothetical protein
LKDTSASDKFETVLSTFGTDGPEFQGKERDQRVHETLEQDFILALELKPDTEHHEGPRPTGEPNAPPTFPSITHVDPPSLKSGSQ